MVECHQDLILIHEVRAMPIYVQKTTPGRGSWVGQKSRLGPCFACFACRLSGCHRHQATEATSQQSEGMIKNGEAKKTNPGNENYFLDYLKEPKASKRQRINTQFYKILNNKMISRL